MQKARLQAELEKTARVILLHSCPLKRHQCKENLSQTTHTAKEELETCALCYADYLIEKTEVSKMITKITIETTEVRTREMLVESQDRETLEEVLSTIDQRRVSTVDLYKKMLNQDKVSILEEGIETVGLRIVECTETEEA